MWQADSFKKVYLTSLCFRKTNIFDSMIYMMENYADNLEDLVAERTGQLIEAKRETEELLYKILPRY